LFWSGNGSTQGGVGTWNTAASPTRFGTAAAGPYTTQWGNANIDSAEFGSAGGLVNLGGPIVVNTITTSIAGVTIGNGNGVGGAANTITFSGANAGINTAHTSGTTQLTALISGTLTKTGVGRLELNNTANPNTSKYVLNAGIITTPAISRFGSAAPSSLVSDFLTFNGGGWGINTGNQDTGANRGITIKSGGAFFGSTSLTVNMTISSPIVGTEGGGISIVGNSGPFTNSAHLAGAILTLSNTANSWNGPTTVTVGTLKLGATGVVPDTSNITLNGGDLDLNGFSDTVGSVLLNNTNSTISGTGTLTGTSYDLRNGTSSSILGGTGVIATKTTSNVVTLSGASTFTGGFNLNAGTVRAGSNTALGAANSPVAIANNTILATNPSMATLLWVMQPAPALRRWRAR
jgi:autotransporter-associated beta strand protein